MSGIKKVLMTLLILLLLAAIGAGVAWNLIHYVMVDFRFYPKAAESLDLRGQKISIRHYEKLSRKLPDCEIAWDVPFQETTYPQDTKTVTITNLTEADVAALDYLEELETVQAEGCRDYMQLLSLQERRPELELVYSVELGGEVYDRGVTKIDVADILPEEIPLLRCLPQLKTVVCSGGEAETVAQLQEYCHSSGLTFYISVDNKPISEDTVNVTVGAVTDEELVLLQFLPNMKQLHISKPKAAAESLIQLRESRPDVDITWEQTICGTVCSSEDQEIDLSQGKITDLKKIAEEMAYFPDAETVFLGECGIDNEKLAAYREEMRGQFKVVWTVQCGEKLKTRTDATTFMPVRENVYYFNDEEAYNLRYCEDMVCIDIGHMSIHNIDFVEYMPNLEFLILAHTQLQYIEPIRHCKNLKFLELDWSPIRDLSPLVECTALEDLNLGNTYADFAPIQKMTWLKNLWMVGCGSGNAYRMSQALPNTKVQAAGNATVAGGWRNLPNYYEMRDLLGMEYMSW